MEQRVAITGIGAVSPLGNTALATWAAMCAGTCGIGPITHFDTDAFAVKVAAEVKGFDGNEYFGKRDAKHLDPCVRFALAASDEAMHDAGFDVEGAIDHERLGVYVGSGVGGMQTLVDNVHTIADRGPRRASPYMIAMMIPNMASGNIAIRHKAKGPTLPVVTACATSAHAVGEAFRAIKHGYADAILAGGAEAAIIPDAVAGFTACRALTTNPDPATACRPFDADRDGFVMGEGACVLVLESMEHAQARGAHIYAEVVGYGNTDDAYHITSPDPEAAGIARAISLAVAEGDVKPSEGLYINAHGTSTKLNDSSETAGIKRALGEDAARAAHVSSTKSMTGHMIGATGAIEVMACAMALEQGVTIPSNAIIDVQVKRIHEYKRQQMLALYIIWKYLDIKNGNRPKHPVTIIFGGKAAPAYTIAQDIIHLILTLSQWIANDPDVAPYLQVVMIENYNVTAAERVIPAADISEQISLASKEASGTSNMKFMLNGALTLCTLDGANVEIAELVGDENIYTFGASSKQVEQLYADGAYDAGALYRKPGIKLLVDFITNPAFMATGNAERLQRLHDDIKGKDWFMALLDIEEYIQTKERVLADYEDQDAWMRKALINIANAGTFSSDRTISQYNDEIWHLN